MINLILDWWLSKTTPSAFSVNPLLYLPLEEGKEDTEGTTWHAMLSWDPSAAWKRWGSHMHLFSHLLFLTTVFSAALQCMILLALSAITHCTSERGKRESDLLAQIFLLLYLPL